MGLIKRKLDQLDASDRSYLIVIVLLVTIPLPVLLIKHISLWFGGVYLLTPFVLLNKDIRGYLACIRKEVFGIGILTLCALFAMFLPGSDGLKALFAAIYVIGGVILSLRSFHKLLKFMESIGVE